MQVHMMQSLLGLLKGGRRYSGHPENIIPLGRASKRSPAVKGDDFIIDKRGQNVFRRATKKEIKAGKAIETPTGQFVFPVLRKIKGGKGENDRYVNVKAFLGRDRATFKSQMNDLARKSKGKTVVFGPPAKARYAA